VPGDWSGKTFAATATDLTTNDTSEFSSSVAAMRTVIWDGNTDGDGDGITWQDANNWSTGAVPGPGDLARIVAQPEHARTPGCGHQRRGAGDWLRTDGQRHSNLNLEGHTLTVAQSTTISEHGMLTDKEGESEFLYSPTVDVLGGKLIGTGIDIIGNVTNAGDLVLSSTGSSGCC